MALHSHEHTWHCVIYMFGLLYYYIRLDYCSLTCTECACSVSMFSCEWCVKLFHRETLLGQLAVYIKSMREDFTQKSTSLREIPQGKNLPQVVSSIVWTRQLEAKVSDTASTAQLLLADLSSFKSFQQIEVEFQDELRDYQQDLFDSWSRDTQAAIGDKKRPLG